MSINCAQCGSKVPETGVQTLEGYLCIPCIKIKLHEFRSKVEEQEYYCRTHTIIHLDNPDDIVTRFYELLQENEQLRERRNAAMKIIEEKREENQKLYKDIKMLEKSIEVKWHTISKQADELKEAKAKIKDYEGTE